MAQKNLQKLFKKPMDRKEFLAHVGAGTLMVIGVSGLLKNLADYTGHSHRKAEGGYGSSPYGGNKQ